ncbi:MAG: PEP-CTERM sorting domain-containing protein [Chthonomonas sp.]|nr:PEP-CTERM sorting domain-containing protein [Chthonomonas sp.]
MKKLALMIGIVAASNAFAVTYNDAVGDVNMPGGYFANQDITSVDVTHTIGTITFRINLNADIVATNWGKYGLMIDSMPGGDVTTGNPWARAVSMPSGMDFWVGSWVDQAPTGFNQLFAYSGGSWGPAQQSANVIPVNNAVQYTYTWAQLGLTWGSTFCFDAWSSGGNGGDAAWDLLSKSVVNDSNNDGQTFWTEATESNSQLRYTIPVPEPGSFLALGLGALALLRRKK